MRLIDIVNSFDEWFVDCFYGEYEVANDNEKKIELYVCGEGWAMPLSFMEENGLIASNEN